jgi:hypothetical protein
LSPPFKSWVATGPSGVCGIARAAARSFKKESGRDAFEGRRHPSVSGGRARGAIVVAKPIDFIEAGVAGGAPKYMEWYGAFGLTVTLVWLYMEILRLLSKLKKRQARRRGP